MKINKIGFAVVLLVCTLITAFAQEKINQLDAKGKKDGVWKGTFEESKRPRYEGTFDHGVEVGTFKYFDDTKAQSLIGTRVFSEKGKVAYTTFFDQKGNNVSEGKTVNRLNEGVWKYYHKASSQLMKEEFYKNGKLEGIQKIFFPDGAIAEETTFKNGLREGVYKIYTPNGFVVEESTFKNNEYDGPAIFRDAGGQIVSKGNFVKNEKKGMWEFYKDGKLEKKEKYPVRVKFEKRINIPKP
ncbi:toxin-antitoxin system YwqK family antitoxin [Flavobacterium sp. SM2513]|uniref:toxin-antitoxin system YwqK family antitoxin n=1 Tax=Flavobacterium sp. SM2513 TaxID=3424766 RepID=UPI003D7FF610